MKRFWDEVALVQYDEEFGILLDGKPIHLPNGGVLRVGPERFGIEKQQVPEGKQ